jgi:undecaprenyl pyrophosphate synthase
MKFKQLLEKISTKFNQKINGHTVMIMDQNGKYAAFIDGEKLDEFKSMADAKKAVNEFIKLAGGSK